MIGDKIEAIPGSPIPAFIVTNKNVEKLVYVKENKILVRSSTSRSSSFIYTYMADRHILLQISSPMQVCITQFIQFVIVLYDLQPSSTFLFV